MSTTNVATSEPAAVAPERDAATTTHLATEGWTDWIPGDFTPRYRVHLVTLSGEPGHADQVLLINTKRQMLAFPFTTGTKGPQWSEHRCSHENMPRGTWKIARPLLAELGVTTELPTQRCGECAAVVVMADLPPEDLNKADWWYEDDEGGGIALDAVEVTGLPFFACYLAQPDPENPGTTLAIGLRLGQVAGAQDHGQQLYRKHRCQSQ